MNFKFLLILILISSCGLKTKPKPPGNTKLPSVFEEHLKIFKVKKSKDKTKNKKKK